MNTTRRVSFRGGWIGLFSGESQGKAIERELVRLNGDGYRLVFVIEDKWSFFAKFFAFLLFCITLGFVGKKPNVLLIGERVSGAAAAAPSLAYPVERGA
ncbi:MAG: hypothetical protein AB7U23_09985 [Dehalococcoidia bacterium]